MKNLFDWIAERTPQYKHLKNLYERTLKDNDAYFELCEDLKSRNKNERELTKELKQDITNKLKALRKIRTYVNKLDKKDENVKAIKQLIKEVL